jgi:hypothetical protein
MELAWAAYLVIFVSDVNEGEIETRQWASGRVLRSHKIRWLIATPVPSTAAMATTCTPDFNTMTIYHDTVLLS